MRDLDQIHPSRLHKKKRCRPHVRLIPAFGGVCFCYREIHFGYWLSCTSVLYQTKRRLCAQQRSARVELFLRGKPYFSDDFHHGSILLFKSQLLERHVNQCSRPMSGLQQNAVLVKRLTVLWMHSKLQMAKFPLHHAPLLAWSHTLQYIFYFLFFIFYSLLIKRKKNYHPLFDYIVTSWCCF